MPAKRDGVTSLLCSLLASGTFWIGMGFILAAPVMNLAYDRMSKTRIQGDGSEMLPEFLATLYNMGGKTGVTILLSSIGVTILILGQLWQQLRSVKTSCSSRSSVPQALRDKSADEPAEAAPAPGHMSLKTGKYFS
jgi:hypothetical protein